jgi:hypothetical protein
MSLKLNCWEVKRCGRQPGGANCIELGTCPAALASKVDGLNHGFMGGRVCWAIAGTLCDGWVQGTYALKLETCLKCAFYQRVKDEEGSEFQPDVVVFQKIYSLTQEGDTARKVK